MRERERDVFLLRFSSEFQCVTISIASLHFNLRVVEKTGKKSQKKITKQKNPKKKTLLFFPIHIYLHVVLHECMIELFVLFASVPEKFT